MSCKVCGSEKYVKLNSKYSQVQNNLCEGCGLLYVSDEDRVLGTYYKNNGYYRKRHVLERFITPSYRFHIAEKKLNSLLSVFPDLDFKNKDILEIGCAYGELLACIKKKYGANVKGIEPSDESAKMGSDAYGIEIFPGLLEEYKPVHKFHIILCLHTLEHIDDPKSFLGYINKLLADDGVLYLEVPNVMKPTDGISYKSFLYSEHLQTFSAFNLNELLNTTGFSVITYSDTKHLQFFVTKKEQSVVEVPRISSADILDSISYYEWKNFIFSKLAPYYNFLNNFVDLMLFKIHKK